MPLASASGMATFWQTEATWSLLKGSQPAAVVQQGPGGPAQLQSAARPMPLGFGQAAAVTSKQAADGLTVDVAKPL